jgi:hypothetical protein
MSTANLKPYTGPDLCIIAGRVYLAQVADGEIPTDAEPVSEDEIQKSFPKGWPFGNEKGKDLHQVSERSMLWYVETYRPKQGQFYEADLARQDLVKRYLGAMMGAKAGARRELVRNAPEKPATKPQPETEQKPAQDDIPF